MLIDITMDIGEADKIIIPVILKYAMEVFVKSPLVSRKINKCGYDPKQKELRYFVRQQRRKFHGDENTSLYQKKANEPSGFTLMSAVFFHF